MGYSGVACAVRVVHCSVVVLLLVLLVVVVVVVVMVVIVGGATTRSRPVMAGGHAPWCHTPSSSSS